MYLAFLMADPEKAKISSSSSAPSENSPPPPPPPPTPPGAGVFVLAGFGCVWGGGVLRDGSKGLGLVGDSPKTSVGDFKLPKRSAPPNKATPPTGFFFL